MHAPMFGLSALAFFLTTSWALPSRPHAFTESNNIYEYANPTWIENIAARSNGDLLVSIIDRPELRVIHPFGHPPSESEIHSFPEKVSCFGITEYKPDVFAVLAGNYTSKNGIVPGTTSLYSVDFNSGTPVVSKIADLPESEGGNGMAALNDNTILFADSWKGNVVKVDTGTGKSTVAIEHESLTPLSGAIFPIGVNGIKIRNGYLYYSNLSRATFNRVKISAETAAATGRFETLTDRATGVDDFDIATDGTAYIALNTVNTIAKLSPSGDFGLIAGSLNSTLLPGPTAVVVGRTKRDKGVVYAATSGGLAGPINGTYTEGGKVVAFD